MIPAPLLIQFANLFAGAVRALLQIKHVINIDNFISTKARDLFEFATSHFSTEVNQRLSKFFTALATEFNPIVKTKQLIQNNLNSTVAKIRVDDIVRNQTAEILKPLDEWISNNPAFVNNQQVMELLEKMNLDIKKIVKSTTEQLEIIKKKVEQNQAEELGRIEADEIELDETFEIIDEVVKEFEEENGVKVSKEAERYEEFNDVFFPTDESLKHTASGNRLLLLAVETVRDTLNYYLSQGVISKYQLDHKNYFQKAKIWLSDYIVQLSDEQKHNYLTNNLFVPLVMAKVDEWLVQDGLIDAIESE